MSFLQIRVLAKNDIQHIVDYYDEQAPRISDKFLDLLFAEFEQILKNPEVFQIKYRETRVRYIKGFPFGIHYQIKGEIVEVLAVLHTSRSPKNWKKR